MTALDITSNEESQSVHWYGKLDKPALLTGCFVLIVVGFDQFMNDSVLHVAENIVSMTFLTEFNMVWFAAGAVYASRAESTIMKVVPLTAGCALYAVLEFQFARMIGSYLLLLQSIWIVYSRLKPASGSFLDDTNLRITGLGAVTGAILVVMHFFLLGFTLSGLAAMGFIPMKEELVGPMWVYGLVWGAYYFDLAFWLPIARRRAMSGAI
jgi:hypothetical protein